MWVIQLLDIVPADFSMAEVFLDDLRDETVDRTGDFLHALEVPQVAHLAMLLTSQRICVNVLKNLVERRWTVHQTPLGVRAVLVGVLEHLFDLSCLSELILHPFVLLDASDFQASWQELEVGLGQNVGMHRVIVFSGRVIFGLENF